MNLLSSKPRSTRSHFTWYEQITIKWKQREDSFSTTSISYSSTHSELILNRILSTRHNNHYISVFQLIALNIFYKQHIKTYVLSKTLKISPTCFGHLATILRETQYLSLLQLLNYIARIKNNTKKWNLKLYFVYSLPHTSKKSFKINTGRIECFNLKVKNWPVSPIYANYTSTIHSSKQTSSPKHYLPHVQRRTK